jgi:hypothetical protein
MITITSYNIKRLSLFKIQFQEKEVKNVYDENELTQFTLDHLQGIFYIYLIALGLTVLIFFMEVSLVYVKAMLY